MKARRLLVIGSLAVVTAGVAGNAAAEWLVGGSGNATAPATSLGAASLTATSTYSSITLTPVPPTAGPAAGNYTILRGTTPVCTTTGTACPDPSLSPATTYVYSVVPALQSWAGPTTTATFSTPPSPTPTATTPSAPASVALTCKSYSKNVSATITVTWPASAGATSYKVYRSTNSTPSASDESKSAGAQTTFDYTFAATGSESDYFWVTALNGSLESSKTAAAKHATLSTSQSGSCSVA